MTSLDTHTITIWAERLDALKAKIAKLSKKALARGLPPITIKVIAEGKATREVLIDKELYNISAKTVTLVVANSLPAIGGHEVVAVRYDDGGIALTAGVMPHEYRHADGSQCDHCGTNRARKRFAIIRNIETQALQLVGSTCYKDYFGDENAGTMHSFGLHYIAVVHILDEEDEFFGRAVGGAYPIIPFLERAAELVLREGYRKADSDEGSTGTDVIACWGEIKPGEDACAIAAAAIAHFSEMNDSAGYTMSVQSMIEAGHVGRKGVNIAASMIACYQRVARAAEQYQASTNEHFGEIKKRVELTLTVRHISSHEGHYGLTTTYIFSDADNRSFKWRASGSLDGYYRMTDIDNESGKKIAYPESFKANIGDTITLKGSIKAHTLYQPKSGEAVRTTEITRCKASAFTRGGVTHALVERDSCYAQEDDNKSASTALAA